MSDFSDFDALVRSGHCSSPNIKDRCFVSGLFLTPHHPQILFGSAEAIIPLLVVTQVVNSITMCIAATVRAVWRTIHSITPVSKRIVDVVNSLGQDPKAFEVGTTDLCIAGASGKVVLPGKTAWCPSCEAHIAPVGEQTLENAVDGHIITYSHRKGVAIRLKIHTVLLYPCHYCNACDGWLPNVKGPIAGEMFCTHFLACGDSFFTARQRKDRYWMPPPQFETTVDPWACEGKRFPPPRITDGRDSYRFFGLRDATMQDTPFAMSPELVILRASKPDYDPVIAINFELIPYQVINDPLDDSSLYSFVVYPPPQDDGHLAVNQELALTEEPSSCDSFPRLRRLWRWRRVHIVLVRPLWLVGTRGIRKVTRFTARTRWFLSTTVLKG
ncbi:hypothetical protein BXZ70DRAFT_373952 [Cristinia sonorae]|uniref:Uncharacterized protein n=1 Tax=Cristinia sonorae TaxID=1940300 RepID=A0A8K0XMN0_9AGAR|nr:hypothetical protein BXZ70DRAFT_373952 [Cristinia sonorae]